MWSTNWRFRLHICLTRWIKHVLSWATFLWCWGALGRPIDHCVMLELSRASWVWFRVSHRAILKGVISRFQSLSSGLHLFLVRCYRMVGHGGARLSWMRNSFHRWDGWQKCTLLWFLTLKIIMPARFLLDWEQSRIGADVQPRTVHTHECKQLCKRWMWKNRTTYLAILETLLERSLCILWSFSNFRSS